MKNNLKSHLSSILNESILKIASVSGSDISQAYKIDTANRSYFLKTNTSPEALHMFQTEAYGLELIAKTNTIKTPQVLGCGRLEDAAFLVLEYIASKSPSSEDFRLLGTQLAQLHQCTAEYFGLDRDNYIGRLPQSNTQHKTWTDFYTHERLVPQLELAKQTGLLTTSECPNPPIIKNRLQPYFENVTPVLLHGDLWSGNYLISKTGAPYLIDPATYYGHNEVDIAMSQLFGGFGQSFYEAYFSVLPPDTYTSTRMEIYQLYYLLVHLNMFGRSYYASVSSILKTIFA